MKLQSTRFAVLFAAVAALSFGAQAADADKTPPAAEMKAEQGAKPVKPHSHAEEKTGVPQKVSPETVPARKNAAQDKSKHYHPRDK
ncbi:MAG: hypothetical protein Q7S85_05345 [Rugosibacter sp.]|nr:hypothetical protein [Rugosibacter sp.]